MFTKSDVHSSWCKHECEEKWVGGEKAGTTQQLMGNSVPVGRAALFPRRSAIAREDRSLLLPVNKHLILEQILRIKCVPIKQEPLSLHFTGSVDTPNVTGASSSFSSRLRLFPPIFKTPVFWCLINCRHLWPQNDTLLGSILLEYGFQSSHMKITIEGAFTYHIKYISEEPYYVYSGI